MSVDSFSARNTFIGVALLSVVSIASVSVGHAIQPTRFDAADLPHVHPVEALARWDAGWYGAIAERGYWLDPGQQSPVAFFPLYPLVVRGLSWLGINRWVAGELLSLVCALAAFMVVRRWLQAVDALLAPSAFLLCVLYPFNVYLFGVMYSDALYLLLGAGAFLAIEKNHPVLAGLLGAFATACRPIAPALVLGLVARAIEKRMRRAERPKPVDLFPAFAVVGFASYVIFLWVQFGDPFAFGHVQGVPGWDQAPGWETWLKVAWFKMLFPRVAPLVAIRLVGHALVTFIAIWLSIRLLRRGHIGYGLYSLAALAIPAFSSKDFMGLGRYAIAAFPVFWSLAQLLDERPRARLALMVVSGLTLITLGVALGMGGYVS